MSVSLMQYDEIKCNSRRGCSAFYQGDPAGCTYSTETRRQARALGWVVGVKNPNSRPHRRRPRLDFCPTHASETRGGSDE